MENHDLIDRYFEKSLRPKEQKRFNELLQNDLNFKNELLFQKNLKQVIAANQKEELKSVLSNIEERAKKGSPFASVPKKWLIAASVMIIMAMTTLILQKTYYPSNEAIYAEYFKRKGNILKTRDKLDIALERYKKCGADGWVKRVEKDLADL